jgi:hypothetical protein
MKAETALYSLSRFLLSRSCCVAGQTRLRSIYLLFFCLYKPPGIFLGLPLLSSSPPHLQAHILVSAMEFPNVFRQYMVQIDDGLPLEAESKYRPCFFATPLLTGLTPSPPYLSIQLKLRSTLGATTLALFL